MKTALIFTLLFVSYASVGQNSTESQLLSLLKFARTDSDKVKIYIDLHNIVFKLDVDKSEEYARQMLKYGKASNILLWENKGYLGLARCYRKRRQYNQVLKYDSLSLLCTQRSANANSIFAAKMELAKDFLDADIPNKAFPFLKECKSLSEKSRDIAQVAKTQQALGWYYFKLNQNTKSIPCYQQAIKAFSKLNNEYMTAECKILLVQSLLPIGRTDSIPELLFSALMFYNKSNSHSRQAFCYGLLGQSFFINGDEANGIENYFKAKHFYNISDNKVEEALATIDLARTYLATEEVKKAESFAKEAEVALTEMKYDYGLIIIKTFWGQFYAEKNNYNLSEQYFVQADKQATKLQFPDLQTDNQRYWIQQLCRQKKYKTADSLLLNYAEKSIKQKEAAILGYEIRMIFGKNKNISPEQAKTLTQLYTPAGIEKLKKLPKGKILSRFFETDSSFDINPFPLTYNRDPAYKYKNKLRKMQEEYSSNLYRDSLQIARQQLKIDKQEKQIDYQISKQKILKAQQDINQRDMILTLTSIIAILSLATILLLNMYKRRAEISKAEIETLKENIIHSTDNNLRKIDAFVDMAVEDGANAITITSMKTRLNALRLLQEMLSKYDPSANIVLEDYLSKLCIAIKELYQTRKKITLTVKAPMKLSPKVTEKIGLITSEIVTNSFKYAFAGKEEGSIEVEVKQEGRTQYVLQITDNGVGIGSLYSKNRGMKLIRDFVDEIRGNYFFSSNGGTKFTLTFNND